MANFKKLALIAAEILGKTSAETAETAETVTDPKIIPPAIFQKWAGDKNKVWREGIPHFTSFCRFSRVLTSPPAASLR